MKWGWREWALIILIALMGFIILGEVAFKLKPDYYKYPVIGQCGEPDEEPITQEIVVRTV